MSTIEDPLNKKEKEEEPANPDDPLAVVYLQEGGQDVPEGVGKTEVVVEEVLAPEPEESKRDDTYVFGQGKPGKDEVSYGSPIFDADPADEEA